MYSVLDPPNPLPWQPVYTREITAMQNLLALMLGLVSRASHAALRGCCMLLCGHERVLGRDHLFLHPCMVARARRKCAFKSPCWSRSLGLDVSTQQGASRNSALVQRPLECELQRLERVGHSTAIGWPYGQGAVKAPKLNLGGYAQRRS